LFERFSISNYILECAMESGEIGHSDQQCAVIGQCLSQLVTMPYQPHSGSAHSAPTWKRMLSRKRPMAAPSL
jgi:hypothetical protein